MSAPEPQRLFFALWPDAAVRERIAHWAERCGHHCGGRQVPDGNLHITLAFAGSVPPERRICLEAAAGEVAMPAFDIRLDRLGYWSRACCLWLSASRPPTGLGELASVLRSALPECGLEPETRPYRMHITLRRRARRGPPVREIEPIAWHARDFALVVSQTLPEGARYEVLRRWPLREKR